jgi:hypothetical protein
MRFRLVAAIVALSMLGSSLLGQAAPTPSPAPAPEPYSIDEFPEWARDLRRFEKTFFGILPMAFFYAGLGFDSVRFFQNDMKPEYAPWPFKPPQAAAYTDQDKLWLAGLGIGLALTAAIIDLAIVKSKRASTEAAR